MEKLYAHQTEALSKIRNGSVLKGGVGTGKSITALAYYFVHICGGVLGDDGSVKSFSRPRNLYIITTAKKRDKLEWDLDAAKLGLFQKTKSFGGVKMVVDSWNNISNYKDVKDAFFIFDEQRLVGSGAWVKSFTAIAANNLWIVLSATPGDTWMDYVPIFVANGFYKNRTEFIRRHVVYNNFSRYPKVDHYVEEGHLLKLRSKVLVEMPYKRHTTRHERFVQVGHNEELLRRVVKDRWNIYDDRPIKNVAELFYISRKVVNSDPRRLEEVRKLLQKHPRLILFYNFDYELDLLRTLKDEVEIREWNGHKHEEIPDADRWLYLVQYTAGSEGWNCTTTDSEVFNSLNYSYKVQEQAKGRIDRLNTEYTDLYYYIFHSDAWIDRAILKALKNKKNFNEKAYYESGQGSSVQDPKVYRAT